MKKSKKSQTGSKPKLKISHNLAALGEAASSANAHASPVLPVDLPQAVIALGMALFSRFGSVSEDDGSPMTVRSALQLINKYLVEGDFDDDTQFCLEWFAREEWGDGRFRDADFLAQACGTSVGLLASAGLVESDNGVVRLIGFYEYDLAWVPSKGDRVSAWRVLHHVIRRYDWDKAPGAAELLRHPDVVPMRDKARQLAYRMFVLCERRKLAVDARTYNEIVEAWPDILRVAAEMNGCREG